MLTLVNYFFYCFYCFVSAKKFDRAGAAGDFLTLLFFFAIMDVYTITIGILNVKSHFTVAGIVFGVFSLLVLNRYYFRPRRYADVIAHYEQNGEPHRVRYALIGISLLLAIIFIQFPLIKFVLH